MENLLFSYSASIDLAPGFSTRKLKIIERLSFHFDAIARRRRWHVAGALHDHRMDEVFVQMIDILKHSILERSTHSDVVEYGEMLHIFAQADTACVRANRDAKLCRHQQYCKDFVDAPETTAVDLTKANCSGLQKLLEHHTVVT